MCYSGFQKQELTIGLFTRGPWIRIRCGSGIRIQRPLAFTLPRSGSELRSVLRDSAPGHGAWQPVQQCNARSLRAVCSQRATTPNATMSLAISNPSGTGWLPCGSSMSTLCKKLFLVQISHCVVRVKMANTVEIPVLLWSFWYNIRDVFHIFHTEIDEFVFSRIFGDLVLFSRPWPDHYWTEGIIMFIFCCRKVDFFDRYQNI